MGLIQDIISATQEAAELEEGTRAHVGVVDELDRLMSTGQTELITAVLESEQTLGQLEAFLNEMDQALSEGFTRLTEGTDALDGRVRHLRNEMLTQLDANEQAVGALLPRVQEALQSVEQSVVQACRGLEQLSVENGRLVEQAEAQADEAEARARQMLASVQAQRQDLDRQSLALVASWEGLQGQLQSQLTALEETFAEVNRQASEGLDSLLGATALGAAASHTAAHTHLGEESVQQLEKLGAALGQQVSELRKVGDRPRQLADQDLTALAKKLDSVLEPMRTIDRIHQKARSLELFDF